jgi:hypothetical protein
MTKRKSILQKIRDRVARLAKSDTVRRAAHTFWQAAVASVVATFAGAGLDLADLTDLSTDQKVATSAVLAGLAAVFSLVKGAASKAAGKS